MQFFLNAFEVSRWSKYLRICVSCEEYETKVFHPILLISLLLNVNQNISQFNNTFSKKKLSASSSQLHKFQSLS